MDSAMQLFPNEPNDLNWPNLISEELQPCGGGPLVLDLFAGCGGLALGFESSGFETLGYEMNPEACETYRKNLSGDCIEAFLTPDTDLPDAEVVVGGVPCQPFSVGGKQRGNKDERDGFPAFIAAVERVRPALFMIENVRGLFYKNRRYLDSVVERLAALGYSIDIQLLNAKQYGVPQNRERVIVVGHDGSYAYPQPSKARPVTAGEALGELAAEVPEGSKFLTESQDAYIAKYEKASKCVNPRDLHMDRPARTLTCRNIMAATGDMHRIRLADGRRRRITVREAARLQSFPDWFEFSGPEASQFQQIGNAVAPLFAKRLAESVGAYLGVASQMDQAALAS
jgi:DNA (cytosine-5)-methyltransferase 1